MSSSAYKISGNPIRTSLRPNNVSSAYRLSFDCRNRQRTSTQSDDSGKTSAGSGITFLRQRRFVLFSRFAQNAKRFYVISCTIFVIFGCVYLYFNAKLASAAAVSEPYIATVLLSCGSFNPPTIMHLRIFELAKDYLHKNTNSRVVTGVISPVHHEYGKKGLIENEHRIAMLRLATKNSKWLCVDDWEAKQPNYCRTIIVLRHVRDAKKSRVMLLCGADLLKSFNVPNVWKREDMEEILRDFGVVVITRSGTNLESVIEQSDLLSRYKDNIHVVTEKISNDISSTKIRQALAAGESVRYFVPDDTLEYIYEHKLYGSSKLTDIEHLNSLDQ